MKQDDKTKEEKMSSAKMADKKKKADKMDNMKGDKMGDQKNPS